MADEPSRDADDEEEPPGSGAIGGDPASEPPAQRSPASLVPTPERRMPVDIEQISTADVLAVLSKPVALAAAITRVDAFDFEKLTRVITTMTMDGEAREGLVLDGVTDQGMIGRGRLQERSGERWQDTSELAIRGIYAQSGRRVLYHEIRAMSARVGRRHNGLGTDKCPDHGNSLHLCMRSMSASDRHCPIAPRPLAAKTRWDRQSERWPPDKVPTWASRIHWPDTVGQTVAGMLADDRRVRVMVRDAIRERPELFAGKITKQGLSATFSRWFVVGEIGCGPPSGLYRDFGHIVLPGRDDETLDAFRGTPHLHGLLLVGEPTDDEADLDGFVTLPVYEMPEALALGVTPLFGVQWSFSPTTGMLARVRYLSGAVQSELWQTVNVAADELPYAVALIERQHQGRWTGHCLARFEADCGPGKLKARTPDGNGGILDMLSVANAAIVDADRRTHTASEFG